MAAAGVDAMKILTRTQARISGLLAGADTRSDAQKIVDALIAERGQKIMDAWWWPAAKPVVEGVLRYPEAVRNGRVHRAAASPRGVRPRPPSGCSSRCSPATSSACRRRARS